MLTCATIHYAPGLGDFHRTDSGQALIFVLRIGPPAENYEGKKSTADDDSYDGKRW